ncbi:YfhH family protein [Piscibacillus salipiscarius]|uniref:YfhH family protein n=1 Tax=Piscibacillus salipiscarius TaxID=299480 RepID=A0ABW5QBR2_9BACI|nr:YfhH family protein [Piscibacillus salipiscarius]
MQRRYSDLTVEELRKEVSELTEKARKAEQMGMVNEYAVHQRKIVMAKSYMMNPKEFKKGQVYEIEGAPGEHFDINYMNGVFAWGTRKSQQGQVLNEEEALPIALLTNQVN